MNDFTAVFLASFAVMVVILVLFFLTLRRIIEIEKKLR